MVPILIFVTVLADIKDGLVRLYGSLLALQRAVSANNGVVCTDALPERNTLFLVANFNMTSPSPTLAKEEETDCKSYEDQHECR